MQVSHILPIVTRFMSTAFVLCLFGASLTWADFQDGVAAYEKGDYTSAMNEWRPLAEEGNPEAQFHVGALYYHGEGVLQDNTQAATWYRRAADQGHVSAQHNLGVMYYEGDGVPQNYEEAFRWFRLASDQGHPAAQYNLGIMYAQGDGIPQDYVRAYLWFTLAAAQGEENAQVGRDFVTGMMTPSQLAEAQRLARGWKPKP